MTETTTTPSTVPAPSPGLLSTKVPSTAAFAVGILLFLLPFMEIRCNSMKLMSVTGVELATGFKVNMGNDNSVVGNLQNLSNNNSAVQQSNNKEGNIFAMIALGAGLLGLLLCLLKAKTAGAGAMLMGIVGAVSLIILAIDINGQVDKEMKMPDNDLSGQGAIIAVSMAPAFYITVVLFIAAAWFGFKRLKSPS